MTEVQAREVSGVTMPAAVSVEGRDLRLNGMGVRREKVFFKAYVIALYLEEPTTEARTGSFHRLLRDLQADVGALTKLMFEASPELAGEYRRRAGKLPASASRPGQASEPYCDGPRAAAFPQYGPFCEAPIRPRCR